MYNTNSYNTTINLAIGSVLYAKHTTTTSKCWTLGGQAWVRARPCHPNLPHYSILKFSNAAPILFEHTYTFASVSVSVYVCICFILCVFVLLFVYLCVLYIPIYYSQLCSYNLLKKKIEYHDNLSNILSQWQSKLK